MGNKLINSVIVLTDGTTISIFTILKFVYILIQDNHSTKRYKSLGELMSEAEMKLLKSHPAFTVAANRTKLQIIRNRAQNALWNKLYEMEIKSISLGDVKTEMLLAIIKETALDLQEANDKKV